MVVWRWRFVGLIHWVTTGFILGSGYGRFTTSGYGGFTTTSYARFTTSRDTGFTTSSYARFTSGSNPGFTTLGPFAFFFGLRFADVFGLFYHAGDVERAALTALVLHPQLAHALALIDKFGDLLQRYVDPLGEVGTAWKCGVRLIVHPVGNGEHQHTG